MEHAERRRHDDAAVFRAETFRPGALGAMAVLYAALGARPDTRQGLLVARTLYDTLGGHRDVKEPGRDLLRPPGRHRPARLRTSASSNYFTSSIKIRSDY